MPPPVTSKPSPEARLPPAPLTVSDKGHGDALGVDDLTEQTQNLQIQTNNPYHQRQLTASASGSNPSSRNPFLAASQSRRPSRRSTPAVGHSTNRNTSAQRGESGYLAPPQVHAHDPRSRTPPGGARSAQQAASRRSHTSHSLSRTSQGFGYAQSAAEPSVLLAKWRGFESTDQMQINTEHVRVPGDEG